MEYVDLKRDDLEYDDLEYDDLECGDLKHDDLEYEIPHNERNIFEDICACCVYVMVIMCILLMGIVIGGMISILVL
jgi:hypothetical protein